MKPETDPKAAFTVTRNNNTTVTGNAAVTLSKMPSANVSLGISRSRQFTVQYLASSWTVSANAIVSGKYILYSGFV